MQASSAADLEGGLATPAQGREMQQRPSSHKFRPAPLDTSQQPGPAPARAQPSLLGGLMAQLSAHNEALAESANAGQVSNQIVAPE